MQCSLFNSSKFADVTIYLGVEATALPAHRVTLGTQSPYFEAALTKDFKEASTREFRFPDHSIHALWRAFEYMYCGHYSEDLVNSFNI